MNQYPGRFYGSVPEESLQKIGKLIDEKGTLIESETGRLKTIELQGVTEIEEEEAGTMLRPFEKNNKGILILRGQMAEDLIYILRSEQIIEKNFQPRSELPNKQKEETKVKVEADLSILEDKDIEILKYLVKITGEINNSRIKITLYHPLRTVLLEYEGPVYEERLNRVLSLFQTIPGKDKDIYLVQGEKAKQILELIE